MKRPVGTLHTLLLLASMILLGGLGLLFAIAPGAVPERMGWSASDQVLGMIRVASAGVLAEATVVAIALGSRSREGIRLVSILLVVHFTAETALRTVNFAVGASDTLLTAVPQAILAVGLVMALVRGPSSPVLVASHEQSADGSPSVGTS